MVFLFEVLDIFVEYVYVCGQCDCNFATKRYVFYISESCVCVNGEGGLQKAHMQKSYVYVHVGMWIACPPYMYARVLPTIHTHVYRLSWRSANHTHSYMCYVKLLLEPAGFVGVEA